MRLSALDRNLSGSIRLRHRSQKPRAVGAGACLSAFWELVLLEVILEPHVEGTLLLQLVDVGMAVYLVSLLQSKM